MKLSRIASQVSASAASMGLVLLTASSNVHGAPGNLSSTPLFLGSSVPPNILFLMDDSDSMRAEVITRDLTNAGAFTAWDPRGVDSPFTNEELNEKSFDDVIHRPECPGPDPSIFGDEPEDVARRENEERKPFHYTRVLEIDPDVSSVDATGYCRIAAEEEWRIRTHAFNTLYYDPAQTYEPWAGADSDGNPFQDASVTAARIDPYNTALGTINLLTDAGVFVYNAIPDGDEIDYERTTSRDYYATTAWNDWCSDKGHTLNCAGWRYYTWDDLNGDGLFDNGEETVHWVSQLSAEEQTNFANWFQYHRSREYATKFAISNVVSQLSNARAGLLTLDTDNETVAIDDLTASHRQDILTALFENEPGGDTPLRERLLDAGEYFSVGGTPESPILAEDDGGACQVNATIMMTDGFYNDTDFFPTPATIGTADNDNGIPYGDDNDNTLADIAMHYYETDLAPALDNIVPSSDTDTATHQHMNTYVVAFGLNGTLDPDTTDIYDAAFSWPDPMPNDKTFDFVAERIDDLWHTAVNGRGRFLAADNSQELNRALDEFVADVADGAGGANSIGLSSFFLTEETRTFVSYMDSTNWSSDLQAFSISGTGELGDQHWSAASILDTTSTANRVILTYDPESDAGIAFDWDELNTAQQTDLRDGGDETEGQARLDYLRGDRTHETADTDYVFRQRDTLIGDIIHSSPIYVGPPALFFPDADPFGIDGERYSDFWTAQQDRPATVYIGANDGMLHGFDVDTGTEVLAYIPSILFPKLADLSDPGYTHQYYVDMTPTIADAYFDGNWHTVAVGGLGAGGQSIYALDITDPATFSEGNANSVVLWEFDAEDDSDLGHTLSRPIVALTNAANGSGKRWAVIVGNGYNADGNSDTGIAHATLFILFLDADVSDGWDEGDDYIKISAPADSDADDNPNGLSSPAAADINRDGIVDRVYAGDVKGNLWAFEISNITTDEWEVAYEDAGVPVPLFTARNADGQIQPITVKPSVTVNAEQPTASDNRPNLLVLFGTGQYITADDPANTDTQTFYGIWDSGESQLVRDDLTTQTITLLENAETSDRDGNTFVLPVRAISDNPVPYGDTSAAGNNGWLLDLDSTHADTGERVIANPSVNSNIAFFTTFIPDGNSCSQNNGSWFMALNALSGGPPPTPTININNDQAVDDYDIVEDLSTNVAGVQIPATAGAPVLGGSNNANGDNVILTQDIDGGISPLLVGGGLGSISKRLSWREPRP